MINRLINDYLKITGRPAATLTVREYLEFAKVGAGDATSLGGTLSASEALIAPIPTNLQDTESGRSIAPVEPKVVDNELTKTAGYSEEKKAEKGASSDSVLSILKSISG